MTDISEPLPRGQRHIYAHAAALCTSAHLTCLAELAHSAVRTVLPAPRADSAAPRASTACLELL